MREIEPRLTLGFYDEHWRALSEDQAAKDRASATNHYAKNDEAFIGSLKRMSCDKPDYFLEKERGVRTFYNHLGFSNLSELHLIDGGTSDMEPFGFKSASTVVAQHYPRYDVIVAEKKRVDDLYSTDGAYVDAMVAHELFHATKPFKTTHANFVRCAGDKKYEMHFRSGFIVDNRGWFFEEGAAVFMAANYVRALRGDTRALGIDQLHGPELPVHMVPPNRQMTSGPDGYAIELVGYHAWQTSAMSPDLYVKLLLDTRRAATQAAALRVFARLVDTIEPGLYVKLRNLRYDKEAWQEGLAITYNGVMRALEDRHTSTKDRSIVELV